MTTCAIYTRVSSDDQVKGNSLSQQERACRAEAERRGWKVVGTFVDDSVSSKVRPDDRDGFAGILASRAEILLAQDLDRVVRDSGHLEDLLREHADLRIVTRDGTDTGSGSHLVTRVKAAVAHEEREKIRLRSTRNRLDRAAQGRWVCGSPPLGYQQVDGAIVQQEGEVVMVREMARLYLASHNTKAVAERINALGYVTRAGNAWDADGVRRVLRNEALVGTFEWRFPGATILGEAFKEQAFTYTAEPVLDATTFSQVTRLLSMSNRGRYRSSRARYPLSGHIYGACGRQMSGVTFKDRHGRDEPRRYRCDAQDKDVCSCRKKSIVADKVENAVATWITVNLLRPDVVEELLQEHRARQADAVEAERQVVLLRKREASLERKQGEVFMRFEGADADRILDRVTEELAKVRSLLSPLQEAAASVDFTADDLAAAIESVVGTATQKAELRSHEELRRLVRMLDVRVDLVEREDGRSIHVTGRISVPELSASVGA